jgi:hypothetical protein
VSSTSTSAALDSRIPARLDRLPTLEQRMDDVRERYYEMLRQRWGGHVDIDELAPSRAHAPQLRSWWARYLRSSARPTGMTRSSGVISSASGVASDGDRRRFPGDVRRPASAVWCALEIAGAIESLGLQVRCGVHTGEVW